MLDSCTRSKPRGRNDQDYITVRVTHTWMIRV